MKRFHFFYLGLLIAGASFTACNNNNTTDDGNGGQTSADTTARAFQLKTEEVTFSAGGVNMKGYVAYDENKIGPRPAIIVVPEWWGLNDYPKNRARQLAELGYIAMAIDLFGDGKVAQTPDSAMAYTAPFYKNPLLVKPRFDAALAKLRSYSQADGAKTAAIGYCFGGTQVLNVAKLGEDLTGVVSFHGGLETVPANKDLLKAKILVCHGGADSFVPATQVAKFRKGLDSIGAQYTFKVYEGATHAFTNPESDANAKKFKMPIAYNPAADSASWNDMKGFFNQLFQ